MERIRDFAAIDFETANGQRTSVCSVGVVVVRGGRPSESIYRLIRPYPNYYSAFTTAIHGLTRSDTENAPSFPDVWGEIAPRIEGLPLVAHNSPFDEGCLRAVHAHYGLPYPDYRFLCTLSASRRRIKGLPNYQAPYGLRSLRIPARTPPPCTGRRRSLCGDRPAAFRIAPRLIRTVRGFR